MGPQRPATAFPPAAAILFGFLSRRTLLVRRFCARESVQSSQGTCGYYRGSRCAATPVFTAFPSAVCGCVLQRVSSNAFQVAFGGWGAPRRMQFLAFYLRAAIPCAFFSASWSSLFHGPRRGRGHVRLWCEVSRRVFLIFG